MFGKRGALHGEAGQQAGQEWVFSRAEGFRHLPPYVSRMIRPRALSLHLSDVQLMAGVQQGEQDGFAALVSRHHGRCFAIACRVLMDRAEAEDAVQEAFMKIWNNAERYDPARGNFVGWLARIVTNCALDRRRMVKNVVELEEANWVEDDAPRADRLAEAHDVHQILNAMPARQRAAISLFYVEGYSVNEVAEAMDSNMKSVESLLSRGRQAFKDLVAKRGLTVS